MAIGTALDLTGYKLTFDDEFNSFSSNGPSNYQIQGETSGTWDTTLSYGERKLNDETELYSDPTVGVNPDSVSGGVLDIHAAPVTSASPNWGETYTSGVITTNHSFNQEYGYFEMRAELPSGAGMWPAFWLLPQQHVWPPELDALEGFGATNGNGEGGDTSFHNGLVTNDTANPNQGGWNSTGGVDLYTSYNTFGVQWTPTVINFFFNGVEYASEATPSDFHQSMYMIANLAVGGNWAGTPEGESADLKIDYIRAFSNDGANPAVVQQTISSPDGGGYNFYGATDANGNGALGGSNAAAPAPVLAPAPPPANGNVAPTGTQTLGTGPDDLVLTMSEDAYLGDAMFTVVVDGVQFGGDLLTGASHSAGATQIFDLKSSFSAGQHTVYVDFLNDADGWAGPGTDRNLYVNGASINGSAIANSSLTLLNGGIQSFTFSETAPLTPAAPVAIAAPVATAPVTAQSVGLPVVRFFDPANGQHFFTDSTSEMRQIAATRPDLVSEGPGFGAMASSAGDASAAPVYRFLDTSNGDHFFTVSAQEKAAVLQTRPDMSYEGVAFYEDTTPQAGDSPVYRYIQPATGSHFYTQSAAEMQAIAGTRPDLVREGVAFYAKPA